MGSSFRGECATFALFNMIINVTLGKWYVNKIMNYF